MEKSEPTADEQSTSQPTTTKVQPVQSSDDEHAMANGGVEEKDVTSSPPELEVHSGKSSTQLAPRSEEPPVYMKGWRLHMMSLCGALCMFLVNVEVSIIGTSLIAITDDLKGFDQMGWVVTGYLITYTGMLIVWTKLSDLFGRKPMMIISTALFTIFSGGCGAAQTMNQLIICRVFQGIGAAGSVSLALAVAYEMVPPEKYPIQAIQFASSIAFGSLVGPLIGGAVSERSTWRWVFLINAPAGALVVALLIFAVPANFPHQGKANYVPPTWRQQLSKESLGRLDVSGAFLLLAATLLLVTVLLEGGNSFEWNSATSISLLVVSGVLWIAFAFNERTVTKDSWRIEPVFPWRFFFNRNWMGTLLMSLFSGIPYNIIIINIPQRFQAVEDISPFGAGVRLIPFNFSVSFGSVFVNILADRLRILPIFLLLGGSILQLVGLALFTTLPTSGHVPDAIYGYEVITGMGVGFVMGICLLLPPQTVERRDLAISSGALLQSRVFGGAIGLAAATAAMNNYLSDHLGNFITPEQQQALKQSTSVIRQFPPMVQEQILKVFAQGYNLQMKIMVGFAAAQVVAVILLWRRPQIRAVADKKTA